MIRVNIIINNNHHLENTQGVRNSFGKLPIHSCHSIQYTLDLNVESETSEIILIVKKIEKEANWHLTNDVVTMFICIYSSSTHCFESANFPSFPFLAPSLPPLVSTLETSFLSDRRTDFLCVIFNGLCVKVVRAVCRILSAEYRVPCAMCSALGWLFIYILLFFFFFFEFHQWHCRIKSADAIGLVIAFEVPIECDIVEYLLDLKRNCCYILVKWLKWWLIDVILNTLPVFIFTNNTQVIVWTYRYTWHLNFPYRPFNCEIWVLSTLWIILHQMIKSYYNKQFGETYNSLLVWWSFSLAWILNKTIKLPSLSSKIV